MTPYTETLTPSEARYICAKECYRSRLARSILLPCIEEHFEHHDADELPGLEDGREWLEEAIGCDVDVQAEEGQPDCEADEAAGALLVTLSAWLDQHRWDLLVDEVADMARDDAEYDRDPYAYYGVSRGDFL